MKYIYYGLKPGWSFVLSFQSPCTPFLVPYSRYSSWSIPFNEFEFIEIEQAFFSLFCSPKMSKAFIQKPAPAFSGTAVNKYGEFIDIKLSDYTGTRKRRIAFLIVLYLPNILLFIYREISGPVLLSPWFVSEICISFFLLLPVHVHVSLVLFLLKFVY